MWSPIQAIFLHRCTGIPLILLNHTDDIGKYECVSAGHIVPTEIIGLSMVDPDGTYSKLTMLILVFSEILWMSQLITKGIKMYNAY